MDAVLRAAAIYLFLVIVFRVAGRRTIVQLTTFDFVLLLIISEATQQGLLGDDFSVTNALVLITTLIGMDLVFAWAKRTFPKVDRTLEGPPLVLVEDGKPLTDRMEKARVEAEEVLEQARSLQGLERMDQIKYAVLERSGGISIIPKRP